jgi:uncharacterized protein (TIGR03118 family)
LVPGTVAAAAAIVPLALVPTGAAGADEHGTRAGFVQTNLVSNLSTVGAQIQDADLQNPWGLALGPKTPLWAADNNSGKATLYSINAGGTTVTKVGLTVDVPGGRASTQDGPSPTGQVFNGTPGFVVTTAAGSGPALFIFDSESGQLSGWNPTADPTTPGPSTATLEYSSPTAVYKGLAIATTDSGTFLYAANFHDGTIDVFDSSFHLTHLDGSFTDPSLPSGYAPFGIQELHGLIYVTYALQNAAAHDDVSGPGHGFVDVYTSDGFLVNRLVSRGALNSPWGLAIAPASFGPFAGKLLVGNFGDGTINVYDPFNGRFAGTVRNTQGKPIAIDDLWSLKVGTATTGGTQTVLFSAGINDEHDGLLGSLNPAGQS